MRLVQEIRHQREVFGVWPRRIQCFINAFPERMESIIERRCPNEVACFARLLLDLIAAGSWGEGSTDGLDFFDCREDHVVFVPMEDVGTGADGFGDGAEGFAGEEAIDNLAALSFGEVFDDAAGGFDGGHTNLVAIIAPMAPGAQHCGGTWFQQIQEWRGAGDAATRQADCGGMCLGLRRPNCAMICSAGAARWRNLLMRCGNRSASPWIALPRLGRYERSYSAATYALVTILWETEASPRESSFSSLRHHTPHDQESGLILASSTGAFQFEPLAVLLSDGDA